MKLIAETAGHHEGDFNFFMQLIRKICSSSADVVKVHVTLDIDEYMTTDHPVYDLLKKWIFTRDQWHEVFCTIRESGKQLMTLVNDTEAATFVSSYSPELVEIHSVALNDIHLLSAVKNTIGGRTRVVLGVGGSSLEEIDCAASKFEPSKLVLMFGFQNYPTKYEDINLRKVRSIMRLYPGVTFGYADHTSWDEPNNVLVTLLGAAVGVEFVEKHVTTCPGSSRADSAAAVSFELLEKIREGMNVLDLCNGSGQLDLNEGERNYSVFGRMKKAAIVKKSLQPGDRIDPELICFKRVGRVGSLSQVDAVRLLGKVATREVMAGSLLSEDVVVESQP